MLQWGVGVVCGGTHGCIFPWEAEKGVWASPVSHVFQNRQKLHGVTRLWRNHTHTHTKEVFGTWGWWCPMTVTHSSGFRRRCFRPNMQPQITTSRRNFCCFCSKFNSQTYQTATFGWFRWAAGWEPLLHSLRKCTDCWVVLQTGQWSNPRFRLIREKFDCRLLIEFVCHQTIYTSAFNWFSISHSFTKMSLRKKGGGGGSWQRRCVFKRKKQAEVKFRSVKTTCPISLTTWLESMINRHHRLPSALNLSPFVCRCFCPNAVNCVAHHLCACSPLHRCCSRRRPQNQ